MTNWMKIFKRECHAIEGDLWDYAERRLGEDRLERVERHLNVCTNCRAEAQAFEMASAALTEVRHEIVPAPQTGWRELERRIVFEQETAAPKLAESLAGNRVSRLTGALVPATSLMTLALVGILVYQTRRPATVADSNSAFTQPNASGVAKATIQPSASASGLPRDNEFDSMMASPRGFIQASYHPDAPLENETSKSMMPRRSLEAPKHPDLIKAMSSSLPSNSQATEKPLETKISKKAASSDEGFKLYPHKPTPEERSHEQRGYVMSNLTPVSNNDF